MRNPIEYPLAPSEVIGAIAAAVEEQAKKQMIGDGILWGLSAIQRYLSTHPDVVIRICQHDRLLYAPNDQPNQNT